MIGSEGGKAIVSLRTTDHVYPLYTTYNYGSPHLRRVLRSQKLIWGFQLSWAGNRWLTICLRNAIREVLGGFRSSLLNLTSVGSGVASPSSLRSTVCKVDSTSSNFTTSTGDSHTTW